MRQECREGVTFLPLSSGSRGSRSSVSSDTSSFDSVDASANLFLKLF